MVCSAQEGRGSGERSPSGLPGVPDSCTHFPLLRKAQVLVLHLWGALRTRQQGLLGAARPGVSMQQTKIWPQGRWLCSQPVGRGGVSALCSDQGRAVGLPTVGST